MNVPLARQTIDNQQKDRPPPPSGAMEVAQIRRVSKTFGGVHALTDVDLDVRSGEVHALCGENGAGKSTLIKILSGVYAPDAGHVLIGGGQLRHGLKTADEFGVSVIHQESIACPDLDAADNIFIGREPRRLAGFLLDRASMQRQARQLLHQLGETVDTTRPLDELPMAQRQMIGIARALSQRCRLLILDEPTASLSARETKVLFRIIRQLRDQGVAVLYVSHRMEEIFGLADRVTVLRDGHHIATRPIGQLSQDDLIRLMVGREIQPMDDDAPLNSGRPGPALLQVRGLTQSGVFEDVSLQVHAGEVVGLAGLIGAGRSELVSAIFGITSYEKGSVRLGDTPLPPASVTASIRHGLAFVPEDRQHLGLVLPMSVAANLSLAVLRSLTRWGLTCRRLERELASRQIRDLQVRAAGMTMPAETLSGGNQQKLVLGKWLATEPRLLILDEPTRGVDVAAKSEIHRRIRQLARRGMATLVISSELPEILNVCDRILVMREGRIAGEFSRESATEEKLLELALPVAAGATANPSHSTSPGRNRHTPVKLLHRRELWLIGMLAVTLGVVGAMKPSFWSAGNLFDIATDAAPIAIIACAVTLVVVTGEIDISVGSLVGLTAATMGLLCYGQDPPLPVPWAIVCSLLVAAAVGAINGLLVTWGRVPSIIATLGMLTVLRGLTKLIMQGENIYGRPESLRELATGTVLGIPNSVWLAAVIAAAVGLLATHTPLGRRIYAVGSNAKAAPYLGISVSLTRFTVFTISGLLSGVAAIILAPRNSLIQPNVGEGMELLVITCVVVGGTSIRGGRGTIYGTILAVLLLSLVPTALTYVGAPPQWRLAIQGLFILGAVLADSLMRRRSQHGGTL